MKSNYKQMKYQVDTTADCWGTQGDEIPIDPWEVIK